MEMCTSLLINMQKKRRYFILLNSKKRILYSYPDTFVSQTLHNRHSASQRMYRGGKIMRFPDPNIGYIFGYKSRITNKGILVTFLGDIVNILFQYSNIEQIYNEKYVGGKISWDVIRWGKCPNGTQALRIILKQGMFRNHFIVFHDFERAIFDLKSNGLDIR